MLFENKKTAMDTLPSRIIFAIVLFGAVIFWIISSIFHEAKKKKDIKDNYHRYQTLEIP
jgi:hypothetical protein